MKQRLSEINDFLATAGSVWPHLVREIDSIIADKTLQLIAADDEQTRGRIKALRDLLDLPETLQQEREGITAALSEQDAANN